MFKIFYSWQSDLPSRTNRGLILTALEKACAGLRTEGGIVVEPVVDRDTLGLSGAPDISDAILSKIREADAFVADVSLVNINPLSEEETSGPSTLLEKLKRGLGGLLYSGRTSIQHRPTPNPNVLVELGYALAMLGNEAIVLVVNTHFGEIEQLPFDLRPLRILRYQARPEDDRAAVRKELERDFKTAIRDIASVVRGDPIHALIYPWTLQVAGQAEGMLRDLINGAGRPFDPESINEHELIEVCESVDPNGQAPLIIGGNAAQGWQYANWITAMYHWRERSRKFTSDILVFSPFIKREHIALLAAIEQCPYFAQLEHLRGQRVSNNNLTWLSNSIWRYLLATRRLKEYAMEVLARRAEVL
jgi:hypothetical protein